jgi:PST family polysaccharide transporter
VTGVAVGVLCALLINYLLMAHLSLSVVGISWLQFARVQLPGLWLTLVMAAVALGVSAGMRHVGLPSLARLLIGSLAAAAVAGLVAWLAPSVTLGEYGIRVRDTLRAYLWARLRPVRLPRSA